MGDKIKVQYLFYFILPTIVLSNSLRYNLATIKCHFYEAKKAQIASFGGGDVIARRHWPVLELHSKSTSIRSPQLRLIKV